MTTGDMMMMSKEFTFHTVLTWLKARVILLSRLIVRCLSWFIHTIDDRGYEDDDDDANDDDDNDANDDEHFPLF